MSFRTGKERSEMSRENCPLITALYLPQYYETEYNNAWWGEGYTEWTAVRQARPLFDGHRQPKVPLNRNYYDLSVKENIRRQMKMARKYGIDGFAIYQYYSCGRKLLEVPTEMIRDDPSLDLPFFLFWANETWRKSWFGQDETVIWEQRYGNQEDWKRQFEYCLDYFRDERYIKIDGKPVYAIYNAWAIPHLKQFLEAWQRWAREAGLPGIYFVKTIGRHDRDTLGDFSATVSREPNYTFTHDERIWEKVRRVVGGRAVYFLNRQFLLARGRGIIMTRASYDGIWKKILSRKGQDETRFLGCFCDWDNSPRKSYNCTIMFGASVRKFRKYFRLLLIKASEIHSPMIVINAWNEWAEGAYLEPDERNGFGYLRAIRDAKKEIFNRE